MSPLPLSVVLPRYVTAAEIAQALQCSPQTVRNWWRRGLLPPPLILSRRKQLWEAEAVHAALARLKAVPAELPW